MARLSKQDLNKLFDKIEDVGGGVDGIFYNHIFKDKDRAIIPYKAHYKKTGVLDLKQPELPHEISYILEYHG